MKIIDEQLLNEVSAEAKDSPRLRMNYNFHQSLEDKCHRLSDARPLSRLDKVHTSMTLCSLLHRLLECSGARDGGGYSPASDEGRDICTVTRKGKGFDLS